MATGKKKGGRVTPKGTRPAGRSSPTGPVPSRGAPAGGRGAATGGSSLTRPGLLLLVGALWIAAGIAVLGVLHSEIRLVPAGLLILIGVAFLRAAGLGFLRQTR